MFMHSFNVIFISHHNSVSLKPHGPATMLTVKSGRQQANIDVSVVVCSADPVPQWPREGTNWPGWDKMEAVQEAGINWVAMPTGDWKISFAMAEKELIRGVDGDGGCRKKAHRLMKAINLNVWARNQKPVVTSYILKVFRVFRACNITSFKRTSF